MKSSVTKSAIRYMLPTISEALDAITASSEKDPFKRHVLLDNSLFYPAPKEYAGLLNHAISDAGSIAFSAYAKAQSVRWKAPAQAALASTDLLRIADLPQSKEQEFLETFTIASSDTPITSRTLAFEHLDLNPSERGRVTFGTLATEFIVEHTLERRGCPIRGKLLERFYADYVTVVFATPLAGEPV